MFAIPIVLLATVGSGFSLTFGNAGTPGVTFKQEGPIFEEAIVDESVVAPGSRVVVATITNVTGKPTISPGIGGIGGGGFGNGPLDPQIEGSGGSYTLSIEVPEHEFYFSGAPDPRHFVEVFEGSGASGTLTIVFKNVKSSDAIGLRASGGPDNPIPN